MGEVVGFRKSLIAAAARESKSRGIEKREQDARIPSGMIQAVCNQCHFDAQEWDAAKNADRLKQREDRIGRK
jgi:hypothetical protein